MNKDLPPVPDIYEKSPTSGAVRQGEFITGLRSITYSEIKRKTADAEILPHAYALVISQDCDLDWDFPVRYGTKEETHKLMQDILFCVVSTAKSVRMVFNTPKVTVINSTRWTNISGNLDERFHFFEQVPENCDKHGEGLPELVADFKLYFSIPVDAVYSQLNSGKALRRCVLKSPYVEHFAQRFSSYQSRVALPGKHRSLRE